jgi:hypothetical protein
MSIPFSRSLRVLDADKVQRSLLVMGLTTAVLIGWILWFFLANITLVEQGNLRQLNEQGQATAEFSQKAAQKIKLGQPAWLKWGGETGQALGLIEAIVVNRQETEPNVWQVELIITDERFFAVPLSSLTGGQAQIAVEQISPATLFLRSSGQVGDAPRVTVRE